jgi:hypothetical protein
VGKVCFVVAEAGCESCAERVRAALEPLASINSIAIDEQDDSATVVLDAVPKLSEEQINEALAQASAGAGHTYRIRHGSWSAVKARHGSAAG